ncbi:MAG TPA: glycosyltransferase family 2 protein [Candidatus Thermoplasmatota archaeon]|nr:glycosyltransferase family 2 protein [Candidatus Thermoplasmatota archaeon]
MNPAADAPRLTIVIPAMNEEEGIGEVIDEIPRKELAEMGWTCEVVVVDGESVDRTRDIAVEKGARVIIEPRKGYGRAYKTGFEAARGEVIATGDADTTYPFDKLPEMLRLFEREGLDFLTTNRFGKLQPGAMSAKHKFGNWVLSGAGRLLFLVKVKDSQSGMWILKRSIVPRLKLTSDGMPLSEEIKIEAFTKSDLRCKEIPIEYRVRVGDVKLSSWKDGWKNLSFLFKKRLGLAEPES